VKRDVALRDVPVILLSWKEDLLQRVRELGASADGYLRKEAAASAVVERVREVLRPRARVEDRVATGGEVRGRLDGLTPRLVLELACRGERDARVSVRDAAFLFEAQVRRGRLVSLTRSAADGSFVRGTAVLASLLGASAGRFSVEPDSSARRTELSGTLFELLRDPVAQARGALRAVTADALLRLERVELDRDLIQTYLACTPEPAASVTRRLLAGASPRELVLSASVSAQLLEVVLSDIARRGGILSAVTAPAGESNQPPALEQSAPPLQSSALASLSAPLGGTAIAETGEEPGFSREEAPSGDVTMAFEDVRFSEAIATPQDTTAVSGAGRGALRVEGDATNLPLNTELTPAREESEPLLDFGSGTKTLEGVGGAAVPVDVAGAAPGAGEPQELGTGVLGLLGEASAEANGRADSAPPKGETQSVKPAASSTSKPPAATSEPPVSSGRAAAGSLPPVSSRPLDGGEPDTSPAIPSAKRRDTPRAPKGPESDPGMAGAKAPDGGRAASGAATAPAASEPEAKKGGTAALLLRSAAAGGIAFFVTTWLIVPMFSSDKDKEAAPPAEKIAAAPSVTAAPAAAPAVATLNVEDLELPRGMEVAPEQGIIEVETNGPEPIYVDEAFVGVGPVRRVAAAAGSHHVEVRGDKPAGPLTLTLAAGRRARVTAPGAGSAAPAASPQ
jgi:hypothetical protein